MGLGEKTWIPLLYRLASTHHTVELGIIIMYTANNPKGKINLNGTKEKGTVVLPDVVLEVARLCSIAASEKVLQW